MSYPNKHWQITSDVDSCLMKKHVGAWMPQFQLMSIFLHSLPEKCSCARHGMKFMLSAKQIMIWISLYTLAETTHWQTYMIYIYININAKKQMMISHLHFLFLMFIRGMTLILDEIPVNPTVNLVEAPKPVHDPKKIPSQLLQYNTSYIWTNRNVWRFPSYGGTPSYHPLLDRIFHEIKPSSDLGVPPWLWKPPYVSRARKSSQLANSEHSHQASLKVLGKATW